MLRSRIERRLMSTAIAAMLAATCAFVFIVGTPYEAFALSKPAKATISSIKATGATKVAVTAKKLSGVKGYQVKYSQNSKFRKAKSVWTSKRAKTVQELKPGTKYYVKVRAYKKTASGKKVYGPWSKTKTVRTWYRISYRLNGGKQAANQRKAYTRYSKTFSLKAPTKKGYVFGGWYSSSAYKTKVTKIRQGSSGNRVFYAKWSLRQYSIVYKLSGGTNAAENPKTYAISDGEIYLADPEKTCCDFLGWYKDEAGTIPFCSIASGSTGNVTVYAKWEEHHVPIWVDDTSVTHVDEETRLVEREFDVCNNPECPSYGLEVPPNHPLVSGLLCNTGLGKAKDTYFHHDAYDLIVEAGHCECANCGCVLENHVHDMQTAGCITREAWSETVVHAGWWCARCDCEVDRLHPNTAPMDEMGHCSIWREDIVESEEHPAAEYELWKCADCGYTTAVAL